MTSEDSTKEGPKFVWTFPLVRRFQDGFGLMKGSNSINMSKPDIGEMKDAASNKMNIRSSSGDNDDEEEGEMEERMEKIDEKLDEVTSNGEQLFAESDNATSKTVVDVKDDVFVPTEIDIGVGEQVEWQNDSNETKRIVDLAGDWSIDEELEPGESHTETFDDEGYLAYNELSAGSNVMCGGIKVGDTDEDMDLPCRQDQERVPFSSSSTPTMSKASDQKEEMERGF